ncbi:hypothetical protein IU470_25410 [Nocardia abscessus]|uniref:Uncharacterized protein n=1 Tax=Nocardia abscessus TaxID=120957 RepID=A0ABS0CJ10_9NOCA|nr:hypothetical protein [Nocardia abscessus]MBF6228433.1 hypothetical protein [Nocardia abscessus]
MPQIAYSEHCPSALVTPDNGLLTRLRTAAEAFLDTIGSANTRRAYGIAISRPSTRSTAAVRTG